MEDREPRELWEYRGVKSLFAIGDSETSRSDDQTSPVNALYSRRRVHHILHNMCMS